MNDHHYPGSGGFTAGKPNIYIEMNMTLKKSTRILFVVFPKEAYENANLENFKNRPEESWSKPEIQEQPGELELREWGVAFIVNNT